jgi:hypothetical protein
VKHELHVRGAIIDLATDRLSRNPDDVQAWIVVRWALETLIDLEQQLQPTELETSWRRNSDRRTKC